MNDFTRYKHETIKLENGVLIDTYRKPHDGWQLACIAMIAGFIVHHIIKHKHNH